MKRFPLLVSILYFALTCIASSCDSNNEDYWTEYAEWREANNAWIAQKEAQKADDGTTYYKKIVPSWNSNAYVLIHYFNDTTLTASNLKPISTSTCDVKYHGRLYDNTAFDSSYLSTSPADSVYRAYLPNMISGWSIAMQNMHVGDSCEVIIPYSLGYGSASQGVIKPYSHLVFRLKFVDLYKYKKP